MRPRLLDLFCGAGGCSVGYDRAGFDVTGVDIETHSVYPYEFHRGDALSYLEDHGHKYDVIHASPPCQAFVQWNNLNAERYGSRVEHPDLIEPVRDALITSGRYYVLENVVGAPLNSPLTMCGSAFGLAVRRHRRFETNAHLWAPGPCQHTGRELAIYGKLDGRRIWTRVDGSEVRAARTLRAAQDAMGIDWMGWDDLREAIPPAYTEFIGRQLIERLAVAA